eukprot:10129752-Alexandrium_andersonii.AAC.1
MHRPARHAPGHQGAAGARAVWRLGRGFMASDKVGNSPRGPSSCSSIVLLFKVRPRRGGIWVDFWWTSAGHRLMSRWIS